MTQVVVAAQRTKAKTLQETSMVLRGYSAAVTAVTSADAITSAAPDANAGDDEVLEKADCAWRAPCKTWGHARLSTGIHPATE